MSTPTPERHNLGRLLAQLTRLFQNELAARLLAAGLAEPRAAHAQITAHIDADGSRLSELAARARMTLPAMAELVDDLERLGIVERRPDPSDGRAKLIVLTDPGREAARITERTIGQIEAEYAQRVGPNRYEAAARALDDLLRSLGAGAR
ncbi:MAG: winged helix DNA-binding protein [Thermoleophilia bacterium]|nr:winged helix DNA-binding protein [Thermoleophilia bacterium]